MASLSDSNQLFIRGVTRDGRTFRPSDWAERLAGVMAPFHPPGMTACDRPLAYSPWCVPTVLDGVKSVIVNCALREHEPMAWDFVMGFARDNQLQIIQGEAQASVAKGESRSGTPVQSPPALRYQQALAAA